MELEVLRKRISTFRGQGGRIRITDDGLLMEILASWEQWPGSTKEFYQAVGVSAKGMASVIGKAKRLKREGHFPAEPFKEVQLEGEPVGAPPGANTHGIEVCWDQGKVIRFQQVDQLIDFLKKVA